MKIAAIHGSGGKATSELIEKVFAKHFGNEILNNFEDAAVVAAEGSIAVTTDSFVVTPLFFKGGDIGKLAICGTVNDLLMSGAVPRYLTCGFIIEEGTDIETLEKIALSMKNAALEAGVQIIAGDTKVIEGVAGGGGVYINTTGIGFVPQGRRISPKNAQVGDAIILSGTLGDHHCTILSARLHIENSIASDCRPLNNAVNTLFEHQIAVKAMRDVTRGGLGTILNEFTHAAQLGIEVDEENIPVSQQVAALSGILGLDPIYMANEGKFIAVVPAEDAEKSVEILKKYGGCPQAAVIGVYTKGEPSVLLNTALGGQRQLPVLMGEGLPRIC